MQVVAGPKGCREYRGGKLVRIEPGEPVPEMDRLNYHDLVRRERMGLIRVLWDEGDALLEAAAKNKPGATDAPRTVGSSPSVPGPLASSREPESRVAPPPISADRAASAVASKLDGVRAAAMKTTRGYTEHLVFPGNETNFLCGTRIEPDMVRAEKVDSAKSCTRCARRLEDLRQEEA